MAAFEDESNTRNQVEVIKDKTLEDCVGYNKPPQLMFCGDFLCGWDPVVVEDHPEPPLSIGWTDCKVNPPMDIVAQRPGNRFALMILLLNDDYDGVDPTYEFYHTRVDFRVNEHELIHRYNFRARYSAQLIFDDNTVLEVVAQKTFTGKGITVNLPHYCRTAQVLLLATWLVAKFKEEMQYMNLTSPQRKLLQSLRVHPANYHKNNVCPSNSQCLLSVGSVTLCNV
ncbi:uncharacterized protein MELLADRAFT_68998 [Melampsora larici-populina 98AG31]|uniref:Uncharacterized protein n=1 Tax=Melampsora larici-populina (strain 98AG31 / pathotype 3-4-7) TaxID=747676 RepID=F4S916_MELLP|nr:uncharacterized protein MELLADRAFT_68998 [Melampsora larici-populina 98AG31]EGF98865.1 hypothetical protein MELLADRAFT_68998 [Melampsora larici-populina 98AG31]